MLHLARFLLVCTFVIGLIASEIKAEIGDPISIKSNSSFECEIETMWGYRITISTDPESSECKADVSHLSSPSEILLSEDNLANNDLVVVSKLVGSQGQFESAEKLDSLPPGRIAIGALNTEMVAIKVDGVVLLYVGSTRAFNDGAKLESLSEKLALEDSASVWIMPVAVAASFEAVGTKNLKSFLAPNRIVLLQSDKSDSLKENLESALGSVVPKPKIESAKFNITATSSNESELSETRITALNSQPYVMPDEVADMFDKKEKACTESQKVFAKLSVEQLNFKPSNGSHTPRWNAEHMMGRELVFFGQIFSAGEPALIPRNLNPKQMPADYEAAHPDWTGAEEAAQMQRVAWYTRRFAYLLDGIPLDKRAPNSFWTVKRLLVQMDNHYSSHTANVIKKFDLDDWPE